MAWRAPPGLSMTSYDFIDFIVFHRFSMLSNVQAIFFICSDSDGKVPWPLLVSEALHPDKSGTTQSGTSTSCRCSARQCETVRVRDSARQCETMNVTPWHLTSLDIHCANLTSKEISEEAKISAFEKARMAGTHILVTGCENMCQSYHNISQLHSFKMSKEFEKEKIEKIWQDMARYDKMTRTCEHTCETSSEHTWRICVKLCKICVKCKGCWSSAKRTVAPGSWCFGRGMLEWNVIECDQMNAELVNPSRSQCCPPIWFPKFLFVCLSLSERFWTFPLFSWKLSLSLLEVLDGSKTIRLVTARAETGGSQGWRWEAVEKLWSSESKGLMSFCYGPNVDDH